jgi:hypothetical protein
MAAYEPQYQSPPQGQYYNSAYGNGGDPYGNQSAYSQQPPQQQQQQQQQPQVQTSYPQSDYESYPAAQPTPQPASGTDKSYTVPSDVNFGEEKDHKKCQDVPFGVFFVIQLLGMVALFGYYIHKYRTTNIQYFNYTFHASTSIVLLFFVSVGLGAAIGFILTLIIRKFPNKSVWCSGIAMVILNLGFGAFLIALGAILSGILVIVFGAVFTLLFLFCVRKRVKFSSKLIKYSIKAILSSWGVYFVALGNLILSGLYSIWWSIGSLSLIAVVFNNDVMSSSYDEANNNGAKYIGIWIGLAFPYFLTTEVFQNIVHFVTCGVTASFWFLPIERNVTIAAVKRASFWSLGTVVFGSTITSTLRTARFAIRAFAGDGSILASCALCLLRMIESLVRFFNVYAFAWASTYGDSYCESSKNTMKMLSAKGFEVIINDELVGMVLTIASLCSGIVSAGIAGSFYYFVINDSTVGPFFLSFICGWIGGALLIQQIYSAVVATIVIWASAPEAMLSNHPEYYNKLVKARTKFYS